MKKEENTEKARQYVDDLYRFKIQCELAAIGALGNPSELKPQMDDMLDAFGGRPSSSDIVARVALSVDSCGNGATILGTVTAGEDAKLVSEIKKSFKVEDRIKAYGKDGYSLLDEKLDSNKISNIEIKNNLPVIIRIELDRPREEFKDGKETEKVIPGEWRGTHSYLFLATHLDKNDRICGRMVQCYFEQYSIGTYMALPHASQDITLAEHFDSLRVLINKSRVSVEERQEIYQSLYGASTYDKNFMIYVKAMAFDPVAAHHRLALLSQAACQETRILCQVAGVAIDEKQLPEAKNFQKDEIWLPKSNFLPVIFRAYERYQKKYMGTPAKMRSTEGFTIDARPLPKPDRSLVPSLLQNSGFKLYYEGGFNQYYQQNVLPVYSPPSISKGFASRSTS